MSITKCELRDSAQKGCLEVLLVRLYLDRLILGTISIIAGSVTLIMLVASFFIRYEEDFAADEDDYREFDDFCPGVDCR